MKRATVLTEVILDLQDYDLSHAERTIMQLNVRIANMPAESRVRFEPCSKCGIILTPGTKNAEHARDCTFEWEQEDIEYAQQCANEKWRSRCR